MPLAPAFEDRDRWLTGSRLVAAAALGVVAQAAVDMPGGYFGAADEVTLAGTVYSVGLLASALLVVEALRRGSARGAMVAPLAMAASVGLFVPALASDPVVAGLVIVWNLVLLTGYLFPAAAFPVAAWRRPGDTSPAREGDSGAVAEWVESRGAALRHLSLASLLLIVGVVGYRLSRHPVPLAVCTLLGLAALGFAVPFLLRLHRAGARRVWVVPLPAALGLLTLPSAATSLALLALTQLLLLAVLASRQHSTHEILRSFYDRPSRLVVTSFAVLILVGTVFLSFPAAAGAEPVSPIDALFTATSAACVTGLIVLDTPAAFSTFGHGVILALIQVGGLGIMVLSTFATLLLGGHLGLRGERALTEMLELETAPTAYRLTRFIVLATLAVEGLAAAGLASLFALRGEAPLEALWNGVFHAVSAFCNAGFALHSDSLVGFQDSPPVLLLMAALIVLGGLGFSLLAALGAHWKARFGKDRRPGAAPPLLPTQARVVLAVSAVLLAGGTVLFAVLEWDGALAGLSVADKLVNALFQSVTLRTAGFNSVGFAVLAPATLVFMMAFMFIGASPGSTGGGVKTTTLAVLLAAIRATAGSREPARLFGREVPRDVVYRSLAILVISGLVVVCGVFVLVLFESQPFLRLLFEVVSAFGTVGLSMGATAELGPMGKLIIIVIMFTGRIGPLTLALLLGTGRSGPPVVHYPETRLMVG